MTTYTERLAAFVAARPELADMLARRDAAREARDYVTTREITFSTVMLEADCEFGGYGVCTHPAQAYELLKLDDPHLRRRAHDEAHTLQNIMGGILSGAIYNAVSSIKRNIDRGQPDAELYGERFAREAREREAELRAVTGDPTAIHNPFRR